MRAVTTFRAIFLAVFLATALLVAALLLNSRRPSAEVDQPTADLVRATGKCAQCHRRATAAIVEEYEASRHAAAEVNCLECHGAREGQTPVPHNGFTIAETVTAANCASCHEEENRQFVASRHAAPAFAAVRGAEPFTPEQIAFAEARHPGAVDRAPNDLVALEGAPAIVSGCDACHSI